MNFEELDVFLSSLPDCMHPEKIRSTTIGVDNDKSHAGQSFLMPITCTDDRGARTAIKVLFGEESAVVMLVQLCPHQKWHTINTNGKRHLVGWSMDGRGSTKFIQSVKDWAQNQFRRLVCDPSKPKLPPLIHHYVEDQMKVGIYKEIEPRSKYSSLMDLVKTIEGHYFVVCGPVVKDNPTKKLTIMVNELLHGVQLLTWVPSNVHELIAAANYTQCDATFRSCRPYVAICVQAIGNNVGIPICLTLAPSERAAAYAFSYRCIGHVLAPGHSDQYDRLLKMPMLSDMGKALASFAEQFSLVQYHCHRHLIERFGAAGILTDIYRSLLNTTTKANAEDIFNTFKEEAMKLSSADGINASRLKRAVDSMEKTMADYDKWGQETKEKRGHAFVARTTNHAEGFHRHMNVATASKRSTLTRLVAVLKLIQRRYRNLTSSLILNARRKFDALKRQAQMEIAGGASEDCFRRKNCICGQRLVNEFVFGVSFPCICNILMFDECPIPTATMTFSECNPPGQLHCPIPEELAIDIPADWKFEAKHDRTVQISVEKGLTRYALDVKTKPWLLSMRNQVMRECNLSKDDATWKVVTYFWTQNVKIDRLNEKDRVKHELGLLHFVTTGTIREEGDPAAILRTRFGIDRPDPKPQLSDP